MSNDTLQAFQSYAMAFEKGYASGDWNGTVGPCLTDDVVWTFSGAPPPLGGVWQGRDAVLATIRTSTEQFDRRFDVREPHVVEGPIAIPGGVYMRWRVTYRRDGLPPFELWGEEWDFFHDGRLELHRERSTNLDDAFAFLKEYGAKLRQA
jgi:ketosteroid isomerase-like protein